MYLQSVDWRKNQTIFALPVHQLNTDVAILVQRKHECLEPKFIIV